MSRPPLSPLGFFRRRHSASTAGAPGLITSAARSTRSAGPSPVRRAAHVAAHAGTVLLMLSVPAAAYADAGDVVLAAPNDLPTVIANVQAWIVGILVAVASLFLVYSGALRATAGGDPAMVERSKEAFKNALVGYAAAVLAPVFLDILQGILGG